MAGWREGGEGGRQGDFQGQPLGDLWDEGAAGGLHCGRGHTALHK